MKKLTPDQAAVVSAYTGYLVGSFSDMHSYAEKKFGEPVFTHQFGDEDFTEELRAHAKADFVALSPETEK